MQAVKSPFVLLLEKDWKLVESRATVLKQVRFFYIFIYYLKCLFLFILYLFLLFSLHAPACVCQLDLAKRLMFSRQNGSRADLVKFRSRWNFGFPNVSPRKTVPPDWDIGVSMVVLLSHRSTRSSPTRRPPPPLTPVHCVTVPHRYGLGRDGSHTCSATSTTTKATRCS